MSKEENLFNDAFIEYQNGDSKKAYKLFTKALKIYPESEKLLKGRGVALTEDNNFNEAIADFTQVLNINPKSAGAYMYRGIAYTRNGDYKNALSDFSNSIKIDSKDPCFYFYRGELFSDTDRIEEAVKDYSKAVSLNQEYAEAYCNRGICFSKLGESKKAISDWKKALEYGLEYAQDNIDDEIEIMKKVKVVSRISLKGNSLKNMKDIKIKASEIKSLMDFKIIKIGKQTWTVSNLDVDCYSNGDKISFAKNDEEWRKFAGQGCCRYYNDDPKNSKLYGKLYNWYAVNDPRGLAPKGWHIPSSSEWKQIAKAIGGIDTAAKKLKSKSGWKDKGGGTNEVGFCATPAGQIDGYGPFQSAGYFANFWSASKHPTGEFLAFGWVFPYSTDYIKETEFFKEDGLSVRCIKD